VSETAIRSAIVDALNATRLCRVWSAHAGIVKVRGGWMHLSPEGTPDVVGFSRSGIFIGIEIKVAGNKTTKERAAKQAAFREAIARAGGMTGVATSIGEAVAIVTAATHGAAA
jgi:hypothetical protein